jgi:predicted Zn-dependent peptidase
MKKLSFFSILFLIVVLISSCSKTKYQTTKSTDSNGYSYETVTNDPMGVRTYTLKNGLKVYFSVTKDAPRIQTLISVKAGSLIEPEQTTGLAHYFEHLMFKGTSHFGTSNWEKENVLLSQISDLFEKRRATTDSTKKAKIFASIDSLSILASSYAIPNEYDKLMQVVGGQGTNAFTSYQGTSYIEDIPSNEIDRWLKLQQERFNNIALRLFHTELETVYEEFNMAQDRDGFKAYRALMTGLFPIHPLGRFVLGYPEHLKNPSMVNIHNFFDTYYVPNNMAIIMTGDFDMDKTIQLIDKTFGQFKAKPFEKPVLPKEQPITNPIVKEVFGPDAELINIGFRFKGDSTEDKKFVTLIDMILNNSAAGLIDLNLVQQQKILNGGSYPQFYIDYGVHTFWGNPREGQKLETIKDLLLGEIEKVKKGEFDDWLIKAVINDLRLQSIRSQEYYQNRAYILNNEFQNQRSWIEYVKFFDELDKITKHQLMQFANENYKDNYVVVYKRKGVDKDIVKVPKPKITPININRDDQSEFFTEFSKNNPEKLKPVFVDFEKEIQQKELKPGIDLFYLPNKTNELFELYYLIDMGKAHDKKLEQAVRYLPYVGTDIYTPAQIQQEFYKLGVRFNVFTGNERSYVYISGLDKSFEQAAGLLEHLLTHAKADTSSYRKYIEGILKERSNNKMNKDYILRVALANYGKYGKNSAFTDIIQEQELHALNPDELMGLVKELGTYKHRILYYGKSDMNTAFATILKQHPMPDHPKECTAATNYPEADFSSNQVYFIDYDMVQTNFLWVDKIGMFDPQILPYVNLYNDYYSNIVFQEIREARGLAYAAGTWIETPEKKDRSFFTTSYVATQADKLNEATSTLNSLMKNMKEDQRRYDLAKDAIMNRIETERITKTNIFWTYLNNLDRGITTDNRKDIYEKVQGISITDLKTFLEKNKSKNYTLLVIGKNGSVDTKILKKLGDFKELSLQEVFNY